MLCALGDRDRVNRLILLLFGLGYAPDWDDEFLTVNEIAEHLRLNQQTVRNWI